MADSRLLITGASSGVGRSLVDYLKTRFEIIAVARRLSRMKHFFKGNEQVHCYGIDLADETVREEQIDGILDRHGPVPYLINNAGVHQSDRIEDVSQDDARYSFEVNAFAPLVLMQKLLPSMQAAGFGRIINITSGAPLNCFPGHATYSASKGALNAFTVTAAREHKNADIKINLMSPGPVQTEMAPDAPMDPSACHPTVDYLLNLESDGPTGEFFWLGYRIPLFPDLSGVQWLEGTAGEQYEQVL
jgi:short-subunit dehydrogenase